MRKSCRINGEAIGFTVVKGAIRTLKEFNIETEVHIMSAHRTPNEVLVFASNAKSNGFGVIIYVQPEKRPIWPVLLHLIPLACNRNSHEILCTRRS